MICICVLLFVYEIYPELLNGFAPNSHGKRVWALTRTSLNLKVKGQDHQGQISSPLKMHCNTLAANNVMQQQKGPFCCCWGDGSAQSGCMWLMFRKISLALVLDLVSSVLCQEIG